MATNILNFQNKKVLADISSDLTFFSNSNNGLNWTTTSDNVSDILDQVNKAVYRIDRVQGTPGILSSDYLFTASLCSSIKKKRGETRKWGSSSFFISISVAVRRQTCFFSPIAIPGSISAWFHMNHVNGQCYWIEWKCLKYPIITWSKHYVML